MQAIKGRIAYVYFGLPHDEYDDLAQELNRRQIICDLIHIEDNLAAIDWQQYDLVTPRMSRGYHLAPKLFMEQMTYIHDCLLAIPNKQVLFFNSLKIIENALDKQHLLHYFDNTAIQLIPSVWLDKNAHVSLKTIMQDMGWSDVVVKPSVASRSWGIFRAIESQHQIQLIEPKILVQTAPSKRQRNEVAPLLAAETDDLPDYEKRFQQLLRIGAVCVQPFLNTIKTHGEISFVFIDGQLHHTVLKRVYADNWIAHEYFGGENLPFEPTSQQEHWAKSVYQILNTHLGDLAYARIDAIPSEENFLYLLECELIAARLFLRETKTIQAYATILEKRIARLKS